MLNTKFMLFFSAIFAFSFLTLAKAPQESEDSSWTQNLKARTFGVIAVLAGAKLGAAHALRPNARPRILQANGITPRPGAGQPPPPSSSSQMQPRPASPSLSSLGNPDGPLGHCATFLKPDERSRLAQTCSSQHAVVLYVRLTLKLTDTMPCLGRAEGAFVRSASPSNFSFNAHLNRIIVSNWGEGTLSVFSFNEAGAPELVQTISLGDGRYTPVMMGGRIIIAHSNRLSVLGENRFRELEVVQTIDMEGSPGTPLVVGNRVIVPNLENGTLSAFVPNERGDLEVVQTIEVGGFPGTPLVNGNRIMVPISVFASSQPGTLSIIEENGEGRLEVIQTLAVGASPQAPITWGVRVIVPNFYDGSLSILEPRPDGRLEVIQTLNVGTQPVPVVDRIFVTSERAGVLNIIEADAAGLLHVVRTITTGPAPLTPVVLGRMLIVPAAFDLTLVNIDTLQVRTQRIPVSEVHQTPIISGNRMFVLHVDRERRNWVSVFDVRGYTSPLTR